MQLLIATIMFLTSGCQTTPKQTDQPSIMTNSRAATQWFRSNVEGLDNQLVNSAGYACFADILQYGIMISGGKFGRGVVYDNNHTQIGWAYINTASAGLQAGAQGFKMLVVFQDAATLEQFKKNRLTGNVMATVVAVDTGISAKAPFTKGVAVYKGAQAGLMAGVSVGLDYMRFEPIE
jgi:lipid-binding SYLF domain-containing protein